MYFKNDEEIFDYLEKKYNVPAPEEPAKIDVCEHCHNNELQSIVEDNDLFTLYESPDKTCTIMRDRVVNSNVYYLRGMHALMVTPGMEKDTVDIITFRDDNPEEYRITPPIGLLKHLSK